MAHVSDLHVGRDRETNRAVVRLARSLLAAPDLDWVCCTGDVTHNGRWQEGKAFARAFARLKPQLSVVPGNHDRLNDNVAAAMSRGPLWVREGCKGALRLVCLDSTQDINATLIAAHGHVELAVVDAAAKAAAERAPGQSVLVLVHHHLVRLAPDDLATLFSELKHLPFASALRHGEALAARLSGRAAAVLHGHRHHAAVKHYGELPIVNAGSTTTLRRYRVLDLLGNEVVAEKWVRF